MSEKRGSETSGSPSSHSSTTWAGRRRCRLGGCRRALTEKGLGHLWVTGLSRFRAGEGDQESAVDSECLAVLQAGRRLDQKMESLDEEDAVVAVLAQRTGGAEVRISIAFGLEVSMSTTVRAVTPSCPKA